MKKENLTKDEALSFMIKGYKVSREYFDSDEYIHMEDGIIYSEEGYDFRDWWDNIEPNIPKTSNTPWRIYP